MSFMCTPRRGERLNTRVVLGIALVVATSVYGASISPADAADEPGSVLWWGLGSRYPNEPNPVRQATPAEVAGLNAADLVQIEAGESFSVALDRHGDVWTWGNNRFGQLGDGSTVRSDVPRLVGGLPRIKSISVEAESGHVLALAKDGTVWAWGRNEFGQLGLGDLTHRTTPQAVPGLNRVKQIAAGSYQSFAILKDRTVVGWGRNNDGQVFGYPDSVISSPVPLAGLSDVTQLASGHTSVLALRRDGTIVGWGGNGFGEVGTGSFAPVPTPTEIALSGIVSIEMGDQHSLAIDGEGQLFVWGYNLVGTLGDGTTTNRNAPQPVQGLPPIAHAAGGDAHTVAVSQAGVVYAWGYNEYGQVGDGTQVHRLVPVVVSSVPDARLVEAGQFHTLAVTDAPTPDVPSTLALEAVLTANDAAAVDLFGYSAAIDGDTAVMGAVRDDDGGDRSGSAYVFVRTPTGWTQQAKLTASDAAPGDEFGVDVAIHGDTIVVSAPFDDTAVVDSGSAYVFTRSGTAWTEQAKLTASDPGVNDQYGWSIAIDTDTIVVGALQDDDAGLGSGSAYVYVRSEMAWTQQAKLTANDAATGDQFGRSVAISGKTILVGSNLDDDGATDSGSVYEFTRKGRNWAQSAKLTASDPEPTDSFGISVALDGDTAIVGAFNDDDNGANSGSAYIFTRTRRAWSQAAKLTASDGAADDRFGFAVALRDNLAVVGAHLDDTTALSTGSAYVFTGSGSTWTESAQLTADNPATDDRFGFDVSTSGSTVLVAAHLADAAAPDGGAAFVYAPQP